MEVELISHWSASSLISSPWLQSSEASLLAQTMPISQGGKTEAQRAQ